MTVYLRAGALRVQSYLARTPQLSLLRGASAALTHRSLSTAAESAGFARMPSAAEVDAILNVWWSGERTAGEDLAVRLAMELRRTIPAAEMKVSWVDTDDTDLALGELAAIDAGGPASLPKGSHAGVLEALPSANELPTLRVCETCRLDSATTTIHLQESQRVCVDCAVRHNASDASGRTFDDLAALDRKNGNHLATVHVDANRLGTVIESLSTEGDFPAIASLSRGIEQSVQAGLSAGREAARRTLGCDDDPVTAHVTGGDDLLVSVPARAGWPFAMACVEAMTTTMRQALMSVAPSSGSRADVSASAGLVFADAHYPFSATAELAYEVLRHAKVTVHGGEASLSWVNVTVEGRRLPHKRAVFREASLDPQDSLRQALSQFALLGGSTRRTLARRYKEGGLELCRRECERLGLGAMKLLEMAETPSAGEFTPVEAELLVRSWWT